jgi:hypothetical protein
LIAQLVGVGGCGCTCTRAPAHPRTAPRFWGLRLEYDIRHAANMREAGAKGDKGQLFVVP